MPNLHHEYTVAGRWPFPTDMLRHDDAIAASPEDQTLINLLSGEHVPDLGTMRNLQYVNLRITHAGTARPNEARWKSFGWTVTKGGDLNTFTPHLEYKLESIHRQILEGCNALRRAQEEVMQLLQRSDGHFDRSLTEAENKAAWAIYNDLTAISVKRALLPNSAEKLVAHV